MSTTTNHETEHQMSTTKIGSFTCSSCGDKFATYDRPSVCGYCAAAAESQARQDAGTCGYGWSGWHTDCQAPATTTRQPDGFRLCDEHAARADRTAAATQDAIAAMRAGS